jgi:hypothetical protein
MPPIENKKVGAGLHITGDRPLARVVLWSIRTVLSLEPYVAMLAVHGQRPLCPAAHTTSFVRAWGGGAKRLPRDYLIPLDGARGATDCGCKFAA